MTALDVPAADALTPDRVHPTLEPTRPVRVGMAGDFDLVRAGLTASLTPYGDRVEVVPDVAAPWELDVDVLLVDPEATPGPDLELARLVRRSRARVVVYAWEDGPDRVAASLRAGAAAYLSKRWAAQQLVEALEQVADGVLVTPLASSGSADRPCSPTPQSSPQSSPPTSALSRREEEIVALVTQGLTNPEIAARLYLSINSVKSYIRAAYRKMGVTRRSQAVIWAVDHGLAPLPDVPAGTVHRQG